MSDVIVVTGMHRSGTSLVASLLQEVGVHMGEELLGPYQGNRQGHFEDVDFLHFHQQLLNRLGQPTYIPDTTTLDQLTEQEKRQASLLCQQRAHRPIWGWKDPRTTLFLNFWQQQLPQARYLLIYRHPLDVILSLIRRGTDLIMILNPLRGLESWHLYNQRLLAFYQQHQARCFLVHIQGFTHQVDQALAQISHKLKLSLSLEQATTRYQATDIHHTIMPNDDILAPLMAKTSALYRQLEAHADLPAPIQEPAVWPVLSNVMAIMTPKTATPETAVHSALLYFVLQTIDPQVMSVDNEQYWVQRLDKQQASLTQLDKHIAHISSLQKKWRTLAQTRAVQIKQHQAFIQAQQKEIEKWQTQVEELEKTLHSIYQTRTWQWARRFWAFKASLKKRVRLL